MIRSFSVKSSHVPRGLFALAVFALGTIIAFQTQLPVATQAQQPARSAFDQPVKARYEKPAAVTRGDVFLDLAKGVGQSAPAMRLLDYKAKIDPASQPRYWAIVDFRQNSTSKRFYVFDTVDKKVNSYYVSHGRGSEGRADDGIAEVFSNKDGSLSSSLGVYRTLDEYVGQHGRSLRVEGLEPTNSNALGNVVGRVENDRTSESV